MSGYLKDTPNQKENTWRYELEQHQSGHSTEDTAKGKQEPHYEADLPRSLAPPIAPPPPSKREAALSQTIQGAEEETGGSATCTGEADATFCASSKKTGGCPTSFKRRQGRKAAVKPALQQRNLQEEERLKAAQQKIKRQERGDKREGPKEPAAKPPANQEGNNGAGPLPGDDVSYKSAQSICIPLAHRYSQALQTSPTSPRKIHRSPDQRLLRLSRRREGG